MRKTQLKLLPGFKRTIVGFDIRRRQSLRCVHMTSYDNEQRPEEARQQFVTHNPDSMNAMNLFVISPDELKYRFQEFEVAVVAFDLPAIVVDCLLSSNVSAPYPLPQLLDSSNWTLAGFDFVDPYTQMSGLYEFGGPGIWQADDGSSKVELNQFGLLSSDSDAIDMAADSDHLFFEHAPFAPCGVWLAENVDEVLE